MFGRALDTPLSLRYVFYFVKYLQEQELVFLFMLKKTSFVSTYKVMTIFYFLKNQSNVFSFLMSKRFTHAPISVDIVLSVGGIDI